MAEGEDIPMEENILAALEGGEVDNVKVENRKASLLVRASLKSCPWQSRLYDPSIRTSH